MAGHSKWANNKHKKAANDAKRGKEFAKLVKNIEVAARNGGGDPAANPTLDDMIKKAKKASVPADNIERARKRGSGEEAGGADWQPLMYEGYAPNGVAMLIECLTDNKNRAATDVRTAMSKNGGNLGESGSVAYMFSRTGYVLVEKKDGLTEDDLLLAVLEAGAEEVKDEGEKFEIICQPTDVPAVRTALEEAGIDVDDSDQDFRASVDVPLDAEGAKKVLKLIDALEDVDDVQDVYTNMTVSDEVMDELNA
ncbi:YebC/PmpR family DNA-binding transcriptional regulator [Corynebacterium sp. MNWGS58]|uniref:YebC/PmpR family DNA-binding transcriptional regulator n=1 Tax=Corynebacterium sp. 102791.4 TaxID=3104612 RepID=UPI0035154EAB